MEDSISARTRYVEMLKGVNADIDVADNGHDGLKMALSVPYDLVVTDVNMPKMTGIELCRALQTTTSTRDIPIIIISTFDSDTDIEIGFEAGASAYLSKYELESNFYRTVSEVLWKFDNVRQKRILVVEDSRSIARFVEVGLMKHSFLVNVAADGMMAKEMLPSLQPDLVLCDLKMPRMDGFALCKWMKNTEGLQDIPFIAMSAAEESAAVQRIIQYGAASYVRKPFSMNQLIPLIDRILSDHFKIILNERERLNTERSALVNSITSLVTALEARDPYTKGHSESVALILFELAKLAGAGRASLELVTIGGRLHDIGKIGIRDSVLLKPDPLTPEEFEHIKTHPSIGRHILSTIPSLTDILPITYSHHERWDGKGYPEGLSGEDIPFWARLTAVADAFDALTSDRPYRKGMPTEKAIRIIRDVRGTQLCPESVDIFLKYVEQRSFQERFGADGSRESVSSAPPPSQF